MIQHLRFHHSAGEPSPIELSRVSALRSRATGIAQPTRLDFHLLQFVIEGRGAHWLDFEKVALRRGDVLHIRPGQVHSFDPQSRHDAFLLMFLPEAVQESAALERLTLSLTTVLHPKPADFTLLLGLLDLIESLPQKGGDIRRNRIAPFLLGAIVTGLGDLLVPADKPGTSSLKGQVGLIHTFERLVEEHYASHRDLGWYVPQLHVTGRTLARACHAVRAVSPKHLIDARVALEAKRHLMVSAASVEEIAFSLGFTEATNFVKFFKRIVGQTPESFRQSRSGQDPSGE